MPLITKSDGAKFGKTEEGAIWLDPKMTSPYKFFQFWINSADDDIENLIKVFSLKIKDEIDDILLKHNKEPHKRIAQKELAKEITSRIHSKEACEQAIKASEILFGNNKEKLDICIKSGFLPDYDKYNLLLWYNNKIIQTIILSYYTNILS